MRWKYHAAEIGESSPTVANGVVYIGDLSGVLHAVDVQTGKALWTFKTQGEIRSSPIVVADKVLIGSYDRYLYGLSARNGALAWKAEFQGYVHATPAAVNGCELSHLVALLRESNSPSLGEWKAAGARRCTSAFAEPNPSSWVATIAVAAVPRKRRRSWLSTFRPSGTSAGRR